MRSNIREMLPAAGAFVMARFGHDGGEVGAAGDLKIAEDEEFVEGGGIAEDGVGETFGGKRQGDGGFEVGADPLFLAGFCLHRATDLDLILVDDIAAGFGVALLVVPVPAEGFEQGGDAVRAELLFVVAPGLAGVDVLPETGNKVENGGGSWHGAADVSGWRRNWQGVVTNPGGQETEPEAGPPAASSVSFFSVFSFDGGLRAQARAPLPAAACPSLRRRISGLPRRTAP